MVGSFDARVLDRGEVCSFLAASTGRGGVRVEFPPCFETERARIWIRAGAAAAIRAVALVVISTTSKTLQIGVNLTLIVLHVALVSLILASTIVCS